MAKAIGVHHETVGVQRKELESAGGIRQLDRTVGADGKEYPRQVERKAPEKSDRQLAKAIGVDHKTVAAQRVELVGTGEIPHFSALQAAPEKSDRQLAKAIGVAPNTVGAARKGLEESAEIPHFSALQAAPEKSDRQLAKAIGVSQPTVSATRKELEQKGEVIKSITSTGLDGKTYPRQPEWKAPESSRRFRKRSRPRRKAKIRGNLLRVKTW